MAAALPAALLAMLVVAGSTRLHAQRAATAMVQAAPPAQRETLPPAVETRENGGLSEELSFRPEEFYAGLAQAAIRLPLGAILGAALALRPRRKPAPPRDPAVIETQLMLAIVGALIMIVVGASLARAFGVAGAANLIRYRAKVDDPKDAVVMLSALAVGLASGVGLFGVAVAGTFFLGLTLWIIEGFETHLRTFSLTVKLGEETDKQRGLVEQVLKRARTAFELRAVSPDELSYLVTASHSLKTERLSSALAALGPNGKSEIEWKEDKKSTPLPEVEPK
jgi:hypothetical protein